MHEAVFKLLGGGGGGVSWGRAPLAGWEDSLHLNNEFQMNRFEFCSLSVFGRIYKYFSGGMIFVSCPISGALSPPPQLRISCKLPLPDGLLWSRATELRRHFGMAIYFASLICFLLRNLEGNYWQSSNDGHDSSPQPQFGRGNKTNRSNNV